MFGPNSRLDLAGSFMATTANEFVFENNFKFSSINPTKVPNLSIRTPTGLNFGQKPGTIESRSQANFSKFQFGIPLRVMAGQTLALLGGDVTITGNNIHGGVSAAEGRIEIGAVGKNSFVKIAQLSPGFTFNYEQVDQFQDIHFSDNAQADSSSSFFSSVPSGNIQLVGRHISIDDESSLTTQNFGQGIGGSISISASKSLELSNNSRLITRAADFGFFPSPSSAVPASGDININTKMLTVRNNSIVQTRTFTTGPSGNLSVKADDLVLIDGGGGLSQLTTESLQKGRAGNQTIKTKNLKLINGGQIASSARNIGNGGDILIQNAKSVEISGQGVAFDEPRPSGLFATTSSDAATGDGGSIEVNTDNLSITNGGRISVASIDGSQGRAGTLTITVPKSLLISGLNSSLSARSESPKDAGKLSINAGDLSIKDGGLITVSTSSTGSAGEIRINASNVDIINDLSGISSATNGNGSGGRIAILADSLRISDQALIDARTTSNGKGGSIELISNELKIKDGGLITVSTSSTGSAGEIDINASNFDIINDLSGISSATNGDGSGGRIAILADSLNISDQALIDARTTANGKGGSIELISNEFTASQGAGIVTISEGDKAAGDITLQVQDKIVLEDQGSGLFANTVAASTGSGGNIFIDPRLLLIRNQAGIGVDSQGTGTGGNITVQADNLLLQNQAFISAETDSTLGGDIRIDISKILLSQNRSLISARAGQSGGGGDGGNIYIRAPFILGKSSENNDILANAFSGDGGSIIIDAESLLGFRVGEELTSSSDINASSSLGLPGSVTVNLPITNPTQGLTQLPDNVINTASLNAQTCPSNVEEQAKLSKFILTGRQQSTTTQLNQSLQESSLVSSWINSEIQSSSSTKSTESTDVGNIRTNDLSESLIEAHNWIILPSGGIGLIAHQPNTLEKFDTLKGQKCYPS